MFSSHIVILGGSSGIGLETARRFMALGAQVTITGRSEDRLAAAAAELGPDARTLSMDAAALDTLPSCFEKIGRFDHLVLALGSSRGVGPFATMSIEELKAGFEEKIYPHFAAAQAALPHLSPNGSMTFISGVAGLAAWPGTAGIGPANAAVAAFVRILAAELKPLRVNGVAPGVIDTPWWAAVPDDHKQALFDSYAAKTPVGRVGKADDVALAIASLVGNDFITGQMLICDGGLLLTG